MEKNWISRFVPVVTILEEWSSTWTECVHRSILPAKQAVQWLEQVSDKLVDNKVGINSVVLCQFEISAIILNKTPQNSLTSKISRV